MRTLLCTLLLGATITAHAHPYPPWRPLRTKLEVSLEVQPETGEPVVMLTEMIRDSYELQTTLSRRGDDVVVSVSGVVRRTGPPVKDPLPPHRAFVLPTLPMRRQLVIEYGEHVDRYTIVFTAERIALTPDGPVSFTVPLEIRERTRIPRDVTWLAVTFPDSAAAKRRQPQLDALRAAIVALGAKPFTPPRALYADDHLAFTRLAPDAKSDDRNDVYEYFHLNVEDRVLAALVNPYRTYNASARGPYMHVWIGTSKGAVFNNQ